MASHVVTTKCWRVRVCCVCWQAGEPARLLLMDSVSAFYCVDRMARTVPLPEPHRSHLAQQGVCTPPCPLVTPPTCPSAAGVGSHNGRRTPANVTKRTERTHTLCRSGDGRGQWELVG